MTKKIFILFLSIIFIALFSTNSYAAPLYGSFAGPDTSRDGLELTNFTVQVDSLSPKVGDTVIVKFTLKNISNHDITFDPRYGAFVGARWNSTTDANNRDFGHQYKGYIISPTQIINFYATRKLDAAGTWRFWPAYSISGKWGPFRWHEIVVEVVAAGTPGGPPTKPPAKGK